MSTITDSLSVGNVGGDFGVEEIIDIANRDPCKLQNGLVDNLRGRGLSPHKVAKLEIHAVWEFAVKCPRECRTDEIAATERPGLADAASEGESGAISL